MNALVESIPLTAPLRDVFVAPAAGLDMRWLAQIRDREQHAYERGRAEGERALSEQLIQQRNDYLRLQQEILQRLNDAIPHALREGEQALVTLAIEAIRRIVGQIPVDSDMVAGVIREALGELESASEILVLVHADDLQLLHDTNHAILDASVAGERVRFQESREVTRGGCIVRTRFGTLDARRESKLMALEKSLTQLS